MKCLKHGYAHLAAGMAAGIAMLAAAAPASAQLTSQPIPKSQLREKCGLDPDIMAGVDNYLLDGMPYVIYRNGYYCWKSGTLLTDLAGLHNPREIFSTTKSFGGILVGAVMAKSSLRDTQLLTDWLTPAEISAFTPAINPQARVAHMLAMASTGPSLAYGQKVAWSYDAYGDREINLLIKLLDKVIAREPAAFAGATNAHQFARQLFQKLGMTQTTWTDDKGFDSGMQSNPADMAKLAELILRRGRWNGEVIVDEKYMYRMSHPSVEDANTGIGYLLWMNADANNVRNERDSRCSPYPRWAKYPHAPFFESPNSNGGFPFGDTTPTLDDGVVWAGGLNGSSFAVHRGLDMVLAVNFTVTVGLPPPVLNPEDLNQTIVWNNIRPALIATLPEFANDDAAFCDAYRRGNWGQIRSPWSRKASS